MLFCRFVLLYLSCLYINGTAHALEFSLQDENLQTCVQKLAQQKQWLTLAAVTEIECHNQHILTVEGIEIFTQLQKLSLFNNEIAAVTALHLPNLRHLNLAKNKIESLQLGDTPALEELYVFNNKLKKLTLLMQPKLKQLKANENAITEFHYENLLKLEKMYLFNNKMVDMDIYHLPAAHYIDVRQNPMPDKLYQDMEKLNNITFLHDGNAKEWQ